MAAAEVPELLVESSLNYSRSTSLAQRLTTPKVDNKGFEKKNPPNHFMTPKCEASRLQVVISIGLQKFTSL
jgi:hypothetical protein